MSPLLVYAQLYSLYSIYAILREIGRSKKSGDPLPKEVLTFYYGHILNVIVFNISWVPAGYGHLLTYLIQMS
jgi:hypothetical protein